MKPRWQVDLEELEERIRAEDRRFRGEVVDYEAERRTRTIQRWARELRALWSWFRSRPILVLGTSLWYGAWAGAFVSEALAIGASPQLAAVTGAALAGATLAAWKIL